MRKLKMKNYNTILTEKQQKIVALLSGKIDKYEYLIGEEILPSGQSRIIEQGKLIEDQGIKQVEALKALKPEGNRKLETIEKLFPIKIRNN